MKLGRVYVPLSRPEGGAALLAIWLAIIFPIMSTGAEECYHVGYLPAVGRLKRTPEGFEAELVGRFAGARVAFLGAGRWQVLAMPTRDPETWLNTEYFDVLDATGKCEWRISIPESLEEAKRWRPELEGLEHGLLLGEFPCDCQKRGDAVWFGLCFYEGEGGIGVGGLGRFDLKTGAVEVRRVRELAEWSVSPIEVQGDDVWAGSFRFGECLGSTPGPGLGRYNWKTGSFSLYEALGEGPAGFLILDLLAVDDELWVATDLGLSCLHRAAGTWEHYLPDPASGRGMRKATREDVYREVLAYVPPYAELVTGVSVFVDVLKNIARRHPRFLRDYLLAHPELFGDCRIATLAARFVSGSDGLADESFCLPQEIFRCR